MRNSDVDGFMMVWPPGVSVSNYQVRRGPALRWKNILAFSPPGSSIVQRTLLRVVSFLIAVSLAAGEARADGRPPPLAVEVAGPGIPEQAAAAVRDAVLARIADRTPGNPPILIVLRADTAEILAGSLRREVSIGAWTSPQAARTVALHVMDLLQPAPALTPVGASGGAVALGARATRTRVTALAGPYFGHGIDDRNPWAGGLALDVELGRGRFSGGLGAAWSRGVPSGSVPLDAGYDVVSARLTGAVTVREVTVGAHAGLGRIFMSGVESWTTDTLVASPFVRSRLTLAENVVVLIEAGVEVLSRPARLLVGERTLYAAPRAAPYLGLALAWAVR
jgi:hypothetical protein